MMYETVTVINADFLKRTLNEDLRQRQRLLTVANSQWLAFSASCRCAIVSVRARAC